jgi:hypothetical protein
VPWYWGVAVYPEDALMPGVPASAATVRVVSTEGYDPPAGPPGRERPGHGCAALVCVDVYSPPPP